MDRPSDEGADGNARRSDARPERLGDYEILGVHGRGGMAVVYRARHVETGTPAAVKWAAPGGEAARRLRAEADAARQLAHPNVVAVDSDGEAEGRPFLVLEPVDGGTLASAIAQPMNPRRAAFLVEILARTIQFAHDQGFVHRDLKPENVLLARDGAPKIADFGIARRIDESAGDLVGTPAYMAPEQADGVSGPESDVYSLGAILYHAIAGRPPFLGETVDDTLELARTTLPVELYRLAPKTPADLDTICLKCLAREPEDRYRSAGALADDLLRFVRNERIAAPARGAIEDASRWARQRPRTVALALAAIGVLVAATFVVTKLWLRADGLREIAAQDEASAQRALKASDERAARAEAAGQRMERRAALATLAGAEGALRDADAGRLRAILDAIPADLRGFEWGYLNRQAESDGLAWIGHLARQRAIALRPDGKQSATADAEGRVALVDAGAKPRFFASVATPIRRLAYASDGRHLAAAGENGGVWVWDTSLREPPRVLEPSGTPANAVAFAADVKSIHIAGDDGSVRRWRFRDEAKADPLHQHRHAAVDVASAGSLVMSASLDRTARLWDVDANQLLASFEHEHWVTAVALAPDGKTAATAAWDQPIVVWNARTGATRFRLESPGGHVRRLALSSDGKRLAAEGADGVLSAWDLTTRKLIRTAVPELGHPHFAAFAADGQLLAPGESGLFPIDDGVCRSPCAHLCVAWSTDGASVAAGGSDGALRIWTPGATGPPREIALGGGAVRVLAAAGERWAAGLEDGSLAYAGAGDPPILRKIHERWMTGLAIARDGAVASGASNGNVWHSASGVAKAVHVGAVHAIAFSPDGSLRATGGADRLATLTRSGETKKLEHDGPVFAVAFHPRLPLLATASADRKVRLWNTSDGTLTRTLTGHRDAVTSLAFAPDGSRLASGCEDGTIKIWDPSAGLETLTLRGHVLGVTGLSFAPTGQRLASSSWDRTVRLWEATP